MTHEAKIAYFRGSECGFRCHICCLRRYPDYQHHLCEHCLAINSRWPPPPKDPPPPEKNPDLIYPGDIDPEFKPSRGDILVVNPAVGPSLRKLGFRGSCVVTYDGSPEFQFVRGDVLVRIGRYEVHIVEPPPEVEEEKGKGKKAQAKAPPEEKDDKVDSKPGAKGGAKGAEVAKTEAEKPPEPDKPQNLVTYRPYELLEVYYYNGDNVWKFMGTQANLDLKNKAILETQCPGLTAFYRYYRAGTKVHAHNLVPFLGEIVLAEWLWQEDFDHKANKWRSSGRWYRPDIPDREKLRSGMILIRPLVGQTRGDGPTLLNCVEMERAKKLEEQKAKELYDQQVLEQFLAMEAAKAAPPPEGKDDKKGKKGKKDEKDDKKKKKDDNEEKNDDKKKKDDKKGDKKEGGEDGDKDDKKKKKGGKKGAGEEEVKEPPPPEVPPEPNNDEFLKFPRWGAVEMYRFEGEGQAEGWTYCGRSLRICDTAYALPSETSKLRFVHVDDRAIEPPVEEPPPEPEVDAKDQKGKKGKKDDKKKADKDNKETEGDKKDKEEKGEGGDKKKKSKK